MCQQKCHQIFFLSLVEPPELIESQELRYPDRDYRVSKLEAPEPILQQPSGVVKGERGGRESNQRQSVAALERKRKQEDEEDKVVGTGKREVTMQ